MVCATTGLKLTYYLFTLHHAHSPAATDDDYTEQFAQRTEEADEHEEEEEDGGDAEPVYEDGDGDSEDNDSIATTTVLYDRNVLKVCAFCKDSKAGS